MRNPVGWFEIYVSDLARARKFYEQTFGVSLEKLPTPDAEGYPDLEMWTFPMQQDAGGAPGALVKMQGVSPGGNSILIYFTCEDCGVTEKKVATAGGRVEKSKFSIGEYGFISLIYDTEGNMIGLHSLK